MTSVEHAYIASELASVIRELCCQDFSWPTFGGDTATEKKIAKRIYELLEARHIDRKDLDNDHCLARLASNITEFTRDLLLTMNGKFSNCLHIEIDRAMNKNLTRLLSLGLKHLIPTYTIDGMF
jgi:hypothetical protein